MCITNDMILVSFYNGIPAEISLGGFWGKGAGRMEGVILTQSLDGMKTNLAL
jgi:hypothetical protein